MWRHTEENIKGNSCKFGEGGWHRKWTLMATLAVQRNSTTDTLFASGSLLFR